MLSERAIGSSNADRAAAFSELAAHHLADSYRLAALILGDRADAEDATHDAFVAAWKSWGSLREPARFEAWFGRILVNVCRDRLRRSRRHGVTDLSDDLLPAPAVGDIAAAAADRDAIGRGLVRLDPDQRIVLVLRYYRDLPVDEIAARVGVPAGTVLFNMGYVIAYDAAADRWETLYGPASDGCGIRPECRNLHSMVYDPVNERLVVYGGNVHTGAVDPGWWGPSDDVLAFDTRTREWTVLLAASRPLTPEASPSPGK